MFIETKRKIQGLRGLYHKESKMKFPRGVRADTITAFEMYHSLTYFTTGDIKKLFNCSPSSATKIKKMALDRMAEEDVKVYCEDRGVVDKDVLYDIAGIDVAKMNRSYKMLKSAKTI